MNIMILGSTGFIGKALHEKLVQDGHNVIGCSRAKGVDATQYQQLENFIRQNEPDVIYNVASHGGSMRYVRKYAADVISDNVQMILNLYRAVNKLNPKIKIIQPFSNCSYPGDSSVQHEENWLTGDVHKSVFSFGNSKRTIFYVSKCYHSILAPIAFNSAGILNPSSISISSHCPVFGSIKDKNPTRFLDFQ